MACIDHGHYKCLNKLGYYRAWHKPSKKLQLLHRVIYAEHHGLSLEAIEGLVIRHTCDNARCINPQHLIIGTQQDNIQDMVERSRHARMVGDTNPRAVLTWGVVRDIRANYIKGAKSGPYSRTALAEKYGVSAATISDIIAGRSWKE